jgi:hypothetical protein
LFAAAAIAQVAATPPVTTPAIAEPVRGNSPVLPLEATVEGVGYAELTAKWWQWARSAPIEPYLDPDGRFCDMDQAGAVWFLAGTDGSFVARRECVVPEGKHLFLPIINMFVSTPYRVRPGTTVASCEELQADIAVNNEHLVSAVVMIDGMLVDDPRHYRVRSKGCFPLHAQPMDEAGMVVPTAASDGYWLLIAPLPRGRHTITVGANYGAKSGGYHDMTQNFEYVLHVGERTAFALR